jgi:hypothetical protein
MAKRMTVHEFAATPHYHPTLAEIWTGGGIGGRLRRAKYSALVSPPLHLCLEAHFHVNAMLDSSLSPE